MEGSVFLGWFARWLRRLFVCTWRGHVDFIRGSTPEGVLWKCSRCGCEGLLFWPRELRVSSVGGDCFFGVRGPADLLGGEDEVLRCGEAHAVDLRAGSVAYREDASVPPGEFRIETEAVEVVHWPPATPRMWGFD
jgi:hypothetical protein